MAYRSSYRSSGRSSYSRSSGYTNGRTGRSFSAARARQHVGTSFGGYTKCHNASTGHYSMQPTRRSR